MSRYTGANVDNASPSPALGARLSQGWHDVRRAVQTDPWFAVVAALVLVPSLMLLSIELRSVAGSLYGIHEWRQGWTYSVAWSFVHEGASFFYPRHAWREHLSGIVGMEPPIYPYVASLLMRVFGDSPAIGRALNFGLFLFGFGYQAKQLGARVGASATLGYIAAVAFCPAALCEFRQWQPDPAMAALSVLAAVFFQRCGDSGARRDFAWGLGLYTLALLTKPIAVCIFPAMYLFSVLGKARPSWRQVLVRGLAFALPLGLMMAWDKWAQHLVATYMEGNLVISIDHDPKQIWASMRDGPTAKFILLGLVENYTSHVVLFPAVLVGIPLSMRKDLRAWGVPYLCWLLGVITISLAYSGRYYSNWYYLLLFVPPLVFYAAVTLRHVVDVMAARAVDPLPWCVALGTVAAACFVHPLLSTVPWDHLEHVPATLAVHVRRELSLAATYWALLAGAAMFAGALAAFEASRAPRRLTALAVVGSAAWAMVIPYKDVEQTVRFYTTEVDWEAGYVDSAEIRAAVDQYSTYQDRFLMLGSNPAMLVRALRVGYADDAGLAEARGPEFYLQRNVRFVMTFSDTPPLPSRFHGAQELARGPRWALFCIKPGACPKLSR